MNKKKNQKKFIFLVLLLAISIGYAFIATTLKINGTSNVKGARWNVYWDNVQIKQGSVTTTEQNKARITDAAKTQVEYSIELSEPGDFYEFTVDAVNDGSLDAMIDTITDNGLTSRQKEYINYSVKYTDGSAVKENDKLTAHTRDTYVVRLEYRTDIDSSKLPEETETIDLTFEVKYIQANNNAVVRPRSCNEYLYAEGNITTSQYNTICGDYIDESIYTYEDNGDGTVKLTGLVDGATLPQKVFALPTSINGKTVTKVAGDSFNSKITSNMLVIAPTIITVEDGISTIGAFSSNGIVGVAIPDSLTYLGQNAFANDSNLNFVNVGNGITAIQIGTFGGCTSLKKAVLNDNITSIGMAAFSNAGLTDINFPKKLTSIGIGAPFSNTKFEKIVIPDNVTEIPGGSFAGTNVKEFNTGNGVTTLEFSIIGYGELKKFVIGDGITQIPNGYFSIMGGARKLEEVTIGKNVTTINSEAFKDTNLTTITIPKKVTTIGSSAIYKSDSSNSNLTKIINKTGKAFDWNNIVLGQDYSGEEFITGTVETPYGNVQITTE